MKNTLVHEFHLMLDNDMKTRIEKVLLSTKQGKSVSRFIVQIISLMGAFIKREHQWGEERKSRYQRIHPDLDVKREHIHVYFPQKLYRQLKLLHQDLNVYSIAQLVRFFLEVFLDLAKEYGANVFQKLKEIFHAWRKIEKENRLTPNDFIRQLHTIILHLSGREGPINIYSDGFSPFWVYYP